MTTVANIKGYINGAEWGVYEEAQISHKTTEELSELSFDDLLLELQSDDSYYYDLLSNSNRCDDGLGIEGSIYGYYILTKSGYYGDGNSYGIRYNTDTGSFEKSYMSGNEEPVNPCSGAGPERPVIG